MLTLIALFISQDTKYLTEFKDGICKMQGKMSFTDEASLVATFLLQMSVIMTIGLRKELQLSIVIMQSRLTNCTTLELEYTSLAAHLNTLHV